MIKLVSQLMLISIFSTTFFCIDVSERKESVDDSMLAIADNGRAQFVGINVNTFAIRTAISSSASV